MSAFNGMAVSGTGVPEVEVMAKATRRRFSAVQAEDSAGSRDVHPTGRDWSSAPPGGAVLLEPADVARPVAAGGRTGLGLEEAGAGAHTEEPLGRQGGRAGAGGGAPAGAGRPR